jgi:hypothetical protein
LRKGRVLEFFSEKLDLKVSFALRTFATVFQAEVYDIMACYDYYSRECKTICICSDSQAVLLALGLHTVSSRLVLQCRNSIQGLAILKKVQLFWVLGRCGIIWNEEADGLAGVGSKSSFCGIEEESALHFICVCSILANLRTQISLSVSEYEGMSAGSFVQFAKKIAVE